MPFVGELIGLWTPADFAGQRQSCCPKTLRMQESCRHESRCADGSRMVRAAALADLLWTRMHLQPNIPQPGVPIAAGNAELAAAGIAEATGIRASRLTGARDAPALGGVQGWDRVIDIAPGDSLLEATPAEVRGLLEEVANCGLHNRMREAARDACESAGSCTTDCDRLQEICDREPQPTAWMARPPSPDRRACQDPEQQLLETKGCSGRRRAQEASETSDSCPFASAESPASVAALQELFASTAPDGLPSFEPSQCNDLDKTDEDQPGEEGDSIYQCPDGWEVQLDSTCASFMCTDTDCCARSTTAAAAPAGGGDSDAGEEGGWQTVALVCALVLCCCTLTILFAPGLEVIRYKLCAPCYKIGCLKDEGGCTCRCKRDDDSDYDSDDDDDDESDE